MSQLSLEQRVFALEQQMAEIKAKSENGSTEKSWIRTLGMFAGDEGMKEIFEEAIKFREKDRERARRRYAKRV